MNPRNFISGAEIADNVSSLNEELLEDSKALHIKRLQALSEKAYLEKVQIEEAATLAAGYQRLLELGIVKPKRRKTLLEMSKKKKIKPSDRKIENNVKIAVKKPQITKIEDIFEDEMEVKRLPPKTIAAPAPRPVVTQSVVRKPAPPVAPPVKEDLDLLKQLGDISVVQEEEEEIEEVGEEEEEVEQPAATAQSSLERFGITQEMLDAWKEQKGSASVYCLFISPEEVFVFTHLKRAEHRLIMEKYAEFSKAKDPKAAAAAEDKLKELVVRSCLLFPAQSTLDFEQGRAGLIDSLFSSIWDRSLFLSPAQREALTVTL